MQSTATSHADSEEEKRRMEEEMVRARLARMRAERTGKGGDFGMGMHGIDLGASARTLLRIVEHRNHLTENQVSMAASLKTTTTTSDKSPDTKPPTAGGSAATVPAWRSPVSTSASGAKKTVTERTPVSLAAFIGGQASGPRLNRHAPQADAGAMYDGRVGRDGAVHPIFGRGGIAMPGMVKQVSPADDASSSARDEPAARTAVASNSALPGASRSASSLAQRYLSNVEEQSWQPPRKGPVDLMEESRSDAPTASLGSLSLERGPSTAAAFPAPAAITRTTSAPSPSVSFPPFEPSPPISPTVPESQEREVDLMTSEATDPPSRTPSINVPPSTNSPPVTCPMPLAASPQPQSPATSTSPSPAPNTNITSPALAPANAPTKSHSAPVGTGTAPSWKSSPSSTPSSTNTSTADKPPVSLAAFMGGSSAPGPRLNRPAPQDDAHLVYDGREARGGQGAVHPVFGRGGVGRGGSDHNSTLTSTSVAAGMPQRKKSSLAERYLQGVEEQRQQVAKPTPRDLGYDLGGAH
ncbi:hypothetical protein CONPUDRAFT_163752 [Coniophora puteana RWD-64-598 SS2]|uniref:Uncharacterized protein n=1 Tax=Coniophora puteana (strain RWD-64-598) TaxID=741705 RepID=A0A5M3MU15_CONPW|nr:uncharacterized protein CONPUDRAFT_163752 [Coniophora puteana RWD-64-598 SS2]EIW82648.1 hypothetical protein CONPUDRAFT_163752 [Coniophora puteana RWD-64-598 SS2]